MSSRRATSRLRREQMTLPPANIRPFGTFSSICRTIPSPSGCSLSTRSHLKSKHLRTRELVDRIWRGVRNVTDRSLLAANRLRFHLFFKNEPADAEYCNSKRIRLLKKPAEDRNRRPFLAVIRCGANHCLIDDGSERKFDIALNLYAPPKERSLDDCEYSYSGGANKYKGAYQFIDDALLETYRGFMFLDDDLEMTYSDLNRFLEYCWAHGFGLAQPSLTSDSCYSHGHLLNASRSGWRSVGMVEVMCPYFSRDALRLALNTFDLSYSTWGLDLLWPRLLDLEPVVVDEFSIKNTKPVGGSDSAFYAYLRRIGVSPQREAKKLKSMPNEKVRSIAARRVRG